MMSEPTYHRLKFQTFCPQTIPQERHTFFPCGLTFTAYQEVSYKMTSFWSFFPSQLHYPLPPIQYPLYTVINSSLIFTKENPLALGMFNVPSFILSKALINRKTSSQELFVSCIITRNEKGNKGVFLHTLTNLSFFSLKYFYSRQKSHFMSVSNVRRL